MSLCLAIGTDGWTQAKTDESVIRGMITDAQTNLPIENANVFLANTTRGNWSAADGIFTIRGAPVGRGSLVVSRIGYKLFVLPVEIISSETLEVSITLTEEVVEVDEVSVMAEPDEEWEEAFDQFRRTFFGESPFTGDCTILNPEVLDFVYDHDTLVARAKVPLRIINQALGYQLSVVLERFIWNVAHDNGLYKIYTLFEEMTPKSPSEEANWKENRAKVWKGSLGHFLSTLYSGKSEAEGFSIRAGPLERLLSGQGHLVLSSEFHADTISGTLFREYTLTSPIRVEFGSPGFVAEPPLRTRGRRPTTSLEPLGPPTSSILRPRSNIVVIGPAGNLFDPLAVEVAGKWGKSRVAELLPQP